MDVFVEIEGLISVWLLVEWGKDVLIDWWELVWCCWVQDFRVYGESYVNVVFIYMWVGGNCFNDDIWGVWYCSWDQMIFIVEVVFYCIWELVYIGVFEDSVCYIEFLVDFIGDFFDLMGFDDYFVLNLDVVVGYFEG